MSLLMIVMPLQFFKGLYVNANVVYGEWMGKGINVNSIKNKHFRENILRASRAICF